MLIPETITRITPGTPTGSRDAMGNPVLSDDVSMDVEIKAFAPRHGTVAISDSVEPFGTLVISGGTVYGYRGTAVTPEDILIIRGLTFQVDGEAGDWLSPYPNSPEGIEFSVKRAT